MDSEIKQMRQQKITTVMLGRELINAPGRTTYESPLCPESDRQPSPGRMSRRAMYGRCPRCKSKSDFSAKRSGAAMYTAYFRLEGYLCRDAAAVAAGPDVIR